MTPLLLLTGGHTKSIGNSLMNCLIVRNTHSVKKGSTTTKSTSKKNLSKRKTSRDG